MKTKLTSILSILLSVSLFSCITEREPEGVPVSVGDRCPVFSVTMNDGTEVSTASLTGQTSVIIFFNTSCRDCRQELPIVQEVYDYTLTLDHPVGIYCIAREEKSESIEKFWLENGLTLPYSPQQDKSVYNLFASSVIPRIYVISPDLTVKAAWSDNPMPTKNEILNNL